MKRRKSVHDGFFRDNTVLSSLMVISPVIVCGDRLKNAIALIYAFSFITFISVVVGSFVPKKIPYAVKVTIYAVISSVVYIPVKLISQEFFPEVIERTGIYFMLLAVNSLIVVQTETKFYRMERKKMIKSLVSYILGFDAVMIVTSVCRELFAYGTVNDKIFDAETVIGGLGLPFGGFIFLGLFCGLYRKIRSSMRQSGQGGDSDATD